MSTSKTPVAPAAMKRSNYFMPEAYKKGLRKIAKTLGGTEADHLREAVRAYLKRHKVG